MRGSRSRFDGHFRPTALLTATEPFSVLIQTTVLRIESSGLWVEMTA